MKQSFYFPITAAFFTIIAFITLISACHKPVGDISIPNLWLFTHLEKIGSDPPAFPYITDTLEIKVLFGPIGLMDVQSFCNTGTGKYDYQGASLSLTDLAMTEIHCESFEPLAWEAIFEYNLVNAEYFLIEDKELIILTAAVYHLHFRLIE